MALRDQPYLPLYIKDFLTDEKLMECSASATGIYIRIMCIMHKSDEYGVILLRQKDKQNGSSIQNFASRLVKHLPYNESEIFSGLTELINEGVLRIEEDKLLQKRMVKDNEISEIRKKAGKKGFFAKGFAKAKVQANAEDANVNENEDININEDIDLEKKEELLKKRENAFKLDVSIFSGKYPQEMLQKFVNYWTEKNKSKTKMRFELEKVFEISKRLATWASRDKTIVKPEQFFTHREMLKFAETNPDIWKDYESIKADNDKVIWKLKS